jgi:hypothetical protein
MSKYIVFDGGIIISTNNIWIRVYLRRVYDLSYLVCQVIQEWKIIFCGLYLVNVKHSTLSLLWMYKII